MAQSHHIKVATFEHASIETPLETPEVGYFLSYFKADGKMYKLDSNRVESLLAGAGSGYCLRLYCNGTFTFSDATIYYMNINVSGSWTTVLADVYHKFYIRKNTVLNIAEVIGSPIAGIGTNEPWSMYVRVNDTTDYLIATVSSDSPQQRIWLNESIDISLVPGDYISIKTITPTWATNPQAIVTSGSLWFDIN